MEISSGRDAVLGLDLREVVLLEAHATVAQLADGGSQVAHLSRRERVLRLARGGPFVDLK
jgi:hypothetical protein